MRTFEDAQTNLEFWENQVEIGGNNLARLIAIADEILPE